MEQQGQERKPIKGFLAVALPPLHTYQRTYYQKYARPLDERLEESFEKRIKPEPVKAEVLWGAFHAAPSATGSKESGLG